MQQHCGQEHAEDDAALGQLVEGWDWLVSSLGCGCWLCFLDLRQGEEAEQEVKVDMWMINPDNIAERDLENWE